MISQTLVDLPFRLESMARAKAPDGSNGTWFKYVIAQGPNRITGIREGSEAELNATLADMVERLNERRAGKTRPRTKPAAAAAS